MSSQNILQLVAQLQKLETVISNVVIEVTTKLTSLTDVNLFLMIESHDGRKICGANHLVQDYIQGSLRPECTDQLATVDMCKSGVSFAHITNYDTDINDLINTRNSATPKFQEQTDLKPDVPNLKREQKTMHESVQSKKRKLSSCEDVCVIDDEDESSQLENSGCHPKKKMQSDSEFEEIMLDSPQDHSFSTLYLSNSSNNSLSTLDFDQLDLPSMKIQALQSIEDPYQIFQKGTAECRLMSSIFYDFGKEVSRVCPYADQSPEAKLFLNQSLDQFLTHFPNLKLNHLGKHKLDGRTPEAHIRNNARAGFSLKFSQQKRASLKLGVVDSHANSVLNNPC